MQEFSYKLLEDYTLCITGYDGDETQVVIPDEISGYPISMLDDGIFKGHTEIESVVIPDSVFFIGAFVFDGCTSLRSIRLPASLGSIFQYTFARCGITELTLPARVRTIPPFAFKDCKALRRVVCPAGMQKIYAWSFEGCDPNLTIEHGDTCEISSEAFASKA